MSTRAFDIALSRFKGSLTYSERLDLADLPLEDTYKKVRKAVDIQHKAREQLIKVIMLLQIDTWLDIRDTLVMIGENLPRFQEAANIFQNNSRIEQALVVVYGDILRFYQVTLEFSRVKVWKLIFLPLYSTFGDRFRRISSSFKQHKDLLDNEVIVAHMIEFRASQAVADRAVAYPLKSLEPPEPTEGTQARIPPVENFTSLPSARAERGERVETEISEFGGYKLETDICEGYVVQKRKLMTGGWEEDSTWDNQEIISDKGAASVWCQKKRVGGQLRAVKILPQCSLQMVARELRVFVTLKDYNDLFVKFFGWYGDMNYIYIVMEYMKDGDLGEYIRQNPLKASADANKITRQILKGLEVLHKNNICHRDLKPPNILISSLNPIWVKIADFGVAKLLVNTVARTGWGTDSYRAPEVLGILPLGPQRQINIDYALDIWSLGCLVHELLTSQTPFLITTEEPDEESDDELDGEFGIKAPKSGGLQPKRVFNITACASYCNKAIEFPTKVLQESQVSEEGIAFVRSLLAPDPRERPTAANAMQHPWLKRP